MATVIHDSDDTKRILPPVAPRPRPRRSNWGESRQRRSGGCLTRGLTDPSITSADFVLRVFCVVDCIGALCAAAVTLSAITKVEKLYNDYDADSEVENSYNAYEYEQAGSYRAGAVLVMCAASMANIYLPVMLFVRCCCLESCVKATCNICANVFVYTNAIICGIFALSLLIGGVINSIYSAENARTIEDYGCIYRDSGLCNELRTVRNSQSAIATMSSLAMLIFVALCIMTFSGATKVSDSQQQHTNSSPRTGYAVSQPSNITPRG